MVKFAIFICLTVANLSFAEESPNPATSPRKERQPEENPRTDENQEANTLDARGKEFSPLSNPRYSASGGNQEIHKSSNQPSQSPSDDRIVWLTVALVIVGGIQAFIYYRQARFMREGLGITRQSAQAAQDSAEAAKKSAKVAEDALHLAERAYLSVGKWQLDNLHLDCKAVAACFLINAGRTPAILTASCAACCVMPDVPPLPNYQQLGNTWEREMPVQVGEEQYFAIDVPWIGPVYREKMKDKSLSLYFHGHFVYKDVFGDLHEVAFFTHYDMEREQFFLVYRPGYNYST